jgi:hypothetical protein
MTLACAARRPFNPTIVGFFFDFMAAHRQRMFTTGMADANEEIKYIIKKMNSHYGQYSFRV